MPPRRAANALLLKGGSLAQAIADTLGVERTLTLLGELRGLDPPFPSGSLINLANEADADVGAALEQAWLQPGLPGFVASPVDLVRLAEDENGHAESHQITVHVRNEEPVTGAVRLGYNEYAAATVPVWVPGGSSVEIGMVATVPPDQLWLLPYASLNREAVRLALPRRMDEKAQRSEAFNGARPSEWQLPTTQDIVVDDLDAGFATKSDDRGWTFPRVLVGPPATLDEGMPVAERKKGEWIRRTVAGSWGTYRHTLAQSRPGHGDHRAVFEADLSAGRWRLDYHLPPRFVPPASPGGARRALFPELGSMMIALVADEPTPIGSARSGATRAASVEFDASAGIAGWNTVGAFDLPGGVVTLEVANKTTGRAVIADAIRWRLLQSL